MITRHQTLTYTPAVRAQFLALLDILDGLDDAVVDLRRSYEAALDPNDPEGGPEMLGRLITALEDTGGHLDSARDDLCEAWGAASDL